MPVAAGLYYFHHDGGGHARPPLVLIHGTGGNYQLWPPEIRRMTGCRIYTLDLPGHGRSEGPGLQSVFDYADRVAGFMKAVGLHRAVIAGHSLGGAIALAMGIDHPRHVVGIALIATGASLVIASAALEEAANPGTYPAMVNSWQERSLGPQAGPGPKDLLARSMAATRPTVFHGDLLACDRFDMLKRLHKVRVPALVLCGTEDKITPLQFSEELASRIPGAALQTIDGAGHMVMLEQPRRLAGILSLFLNTIPFTPGA
ncbi:MAG: alpha/beta hydrolase [Anaerolineales bacterium]|nr:alpha/beta hydrolase [Anaerolineales bacterium]